MLAPRGQLASPRQNRGKEWAHVVDVNQEMTNFHELIPEMAHQVKNQLSKTYISIHLNWIIFRKKPYITLKMEIPYLSQRILQPVKL